MPAGSADARLTGSSSSQRPAESLRPRPRTRLVFRYVGEEKRESKPALKSTPSDGEPDKPDAKRFRQKAILAAVLAVALVGWLVFRDDGESSPKSGSGPEAATVDSLRERAAERATPIYWAGPQDEADLEVTETEDGGRAYIRYLTGEASPGDPRPALTVGTYVFNDAARALKRQAGEPGGLLETAPGGATVFLTRNQPQSVCLAYPGVDRQIEVYDPHPKRALNLVR